MIVGGKEFPETSAGYRAAAKHVRELGPYFASDARGLYAEADDIDRRRLAMRVFMAIGVVAALVLGLWRAYV